MSRDNKGRRVYSDYNAVAVWVLIAFFSITIVIFAIYEGVSRPLPSPYQACLVLLLSSIPNSLDCVYAQNGGDPILF